MKPWLTFFFSFLITDHSVLYCSTVLYSLSTYFTLFLTRINTYASEDRHSQPRKSLHTLRQSINQMYQNLALKCQCKHFRLFRESLYQLRQYSFEKKKKNLFPDTRFLSQCNYVVQVLLWRVRVKSDADMLTETYISQPKRAFKYA